MCIIKFYFQTGFKQSPQSVKMIYIIPLGTDLHLEEPVGLQMGDCEICKMKIALDKKKTTWMNTLKKKGKTFIYRKT